MSIRRLTGKQERSDQLALTADCKSGKSFKPPACRNLRFGVQPMRQQDEMFVGNASLAHSRQEMDKQPFG